MAAIAFNATDPPKFIIHKTRLYEKNRNTTW